MPLERCFDLARDVDVHCKTTQWTKERVVAGVSSGLLGMGDTLTFEAVHFGVRQRLTARITEFHRPTLFVDEAEKSAFASLRHIHTFTSANGGTLMRDIIEFTSPMGVIGMIADRLFLIIYMRRFLEKRNAALKSLAEATAG